MIRTLTLAAGLAIGASAAQAAFTGVAYVEGNSAAASTAIGGAAITFQIFATFDAAPGTNTLVSTGFGNINASGGGTFFNVGAPFGGDTAGNSGFFGFAPTLAYDTWGTVGVSDGADVNATAVSTSPGTAITSTNITGGWFNSNPPNNIGLASAQASLGGGLGTLLFQITVVTPDVGASVANITSLINGQFSAFEDDGAGNAIEHVIVIPTPGAMALFGIAGLAATRRRR